MKLEDWQQYVLWAWHDIDEAGKWAASECGLLVSRQNGKSEILVAYDLARLFLFPLPDKRRRTVLHTAHELKTATETFEKLSSIIASNDRLMTLVQNIYTGSGKEVVLLKPRPGQLLGDRVRFVARSKNSGRGFAASDIVYDEAQELARNTRKALTYTQTTIPNRQELYVGTVPGPENDGEVFEAVRDRGRSGAPRTAWQEWSPEGAEDPKLAEKIDVNDPQVWVQSIPAMGTPWIEVSTIAEQVERAQDRDELLTERFAVWPSRPAVEAVKLSELDLEVWKRHADADAAVTGDGMWLSLALGRGGGYGTIGKAVRVDSERIAVEHHRTDRGTMWVAKELRALQDETGAQVILDPKNAAAVMASLDRAKVRYVEMTFDEVAAAHSLFIEHVNAGLVPHRDQVEVTKSLQLATTRNVGRAGVTWEQSDPTKPISQAQAVTWALYGVLRSESLVPKTPRPPSRASVVRVEPAERENDPRSMRF